MQLKYLKISKDTTFKSLLETLENRSEENSNRHPTLNWKEVEKRLTDQPDKLQSLQRMEESGGEPALVNFERKSAEYFFLDCEKKVQKSAEVYAMIKKLWKNGKKINRKTVQKILQSNLVQNFLMKNNIGFCKLSETLH